VKGPAGPAGLAGHDPTVLDVRDPSRRPWQIREWQVQRLAWVLAALVLTAAMLGLFGGGVLSATTARSPDGTIEVSYERFVRKDATEVLQVRVTPDQDAGSATVFLGAEWVDAVIIEGIEPQPDTVSAAEGGMLLEIPTEDAAPVQLRVSFRPDAVGVVSASFAVAPGAEGAPLWQLTYP
jgi:hypothetical protein